MNKITLITGATSGIGKAAAEKFAEKGHALILTGRRKEKLEEVSESIRAKYGVEIFPLCFDIRKLADVQHAIDNLPAEWKEIDILINNAGLAVGLNPIQSGVIDDWERMIDTNIKGLLYITRLVSPGMVERRKGHIVNIGSIAGREVYSNGNVYCATKHAVDALSKAMRIDLLPYNIRVSQVAPGQAETEFSLVRFKGDEEKAKAVYEGFIPLTAEDIADVILYVCEAPPHVNINDVLVMPTAQASISITHRDKNVK
ncbi:MAG: SDR family oxidoreductase [Candidatus Azobacteroides sp.]|nr:SDR family oxidoreductase [Candidatus Azobacteroides sp.]